jgi:ferredoxin
MENKQLEGSVMAVHIDEDECIGCGTCEEICPAVFRLNTDTEKAEVIMPEGGPGDLIEEAIDSCPASCIYEED